MRFVYMSFMKAQVSLIVTALDIVCSSGCSSSEGGSKVEILLIWIRRAG